MFVHICFHQQSQLLLLRDWLISSIIYTFHIMCSQICVIFVICVMCDRLSKFNIFITTEMCEQKLRICDGSSTREGLLQGIATFVESAAALCSRSSRSSRSNRSSRSSRSSRRSRRSRSSRRSRRGRSSTILPCTALHCSCELPTLAKSQVGPKVSVLSSTITALARGSVIQIDLVTECALDLSKI